jgi:hypothetical protein
VDIHSLTWGKETYVSGLLFTAVISFEIFAQRLSLRISAPLFVLQSSSRQLLRRLIRWSQPWPLVASIGWG